MIYYNNGLYFTVPFFFLFVILFFCLFYSFLYVIIYSFSIFRFSLFPQQGELGKLLCTQHYQDIISLISSYHRRLGIPSIWLRNSCNTLISQNLLVFLTFLLDDMEIFALSE